jgi:hypothetical protein
MSRAQSGSLGRPKKEVAKPQNLMLQSFSSNQTQSIPINETLEDALVDLYLSVKIRSNDEVSNRSVKLICRLTAMTNRS